MHPILNHKKDPVSGAYAGYCKTEEINWFSKAFVQECEASGHDVIYFTPSSAPDSDPPASSTTVTFASGATSSENLPPFWMIPRSLDESVARRLANGAAKYEINNWKRGLSEVRYIRDRVDHLHKHLKNIENGIETSEDSLRDNIDAVTWGAMFLAEAFARDDGKTLREAFYSEHRGEKGV